MPRLKVFLVLALLLIVPQGALARRKRKRKHRSGKSAMQISREYYANRPSDGGHGSSSQTVEEARRKFAGARAQLEKWMALPDTSHLRKSDWYNLGVRMMELASDDTELEEAEEPLRIALRLAPQATDVLGNLGIVLSRQGKLREALVFFDMARKIDPDDKRAQTNYRKAAEMRVSQASMEGGTSDGDPRTQAEKLEDRARDQKGSKQHQRTVKITTDELIRGTGAGAEFDQATRQRVLNDVIRQRRRDENGGDL
jgi:tetratricopeptide (TPR) repeat protein